jgi:hypothetical protein
MRAFNFCLLAWRTVEKSEENSRKYCRKQWRSLQKIAEKPAEASREVCRNN